MRKLIAAINMTIDGFCDHTVMTAADEELHQHYTDLLRDGGAILYGRITYQLMESYWPSVVKNPTGVKATDDFGVTLENIPKLVFSHTLKNVNWKNVNLATEDIKSEVLKLKQQPGRDILVGSPSLIVQCMKLDLVDEYQLCVHPVVVGKGLPLFKDVNDKTIFKLLKTKTFGSGAILHYYQPTTK